MMSAILRVVYIPLAAWALLGTPAAVAQGTISTVAGGDGFLDNIPAIHARLDGPGALAVDPRGNAYIGDGERIRRIDAKTGIISTVAGNGNASSFQDGKATAVSLAGAQYFAFDPAGRLLFLDSLRLMRLDLVAGTLTTIAGGMAKRRRSSAS